MRVEHFRVRNFTSLVDVDLPNLPNLVVFIGKNSSGKSNLVDALALLFSEFGTALERELGSPDVFQHLFAGHNTQTNQIPEISATITLTSKEWGEVLSVDEITVANWEECEIVLGKRITVTDGIARWETSTVEIGAIKAVSNGKSGQDEIPIDSGTEFDPPRLVFLDQFLSQLAELLKSRLSVIHTTDNLRSWRDRFSERPTIIDTEHVDNLWSLSQSTGNRRRPWTQMTQQYEDIAPNRQRPVGVASTIQVEEGNLTVPIGMIGEGSQAMLRLIDQLERGAPIMVIEEPETHLHPALVKRVGELLADTSRKGKQLFICTHSPFLVEQSSLDSFFVVKKERDRTQVSSIGHIDQLKELLLDIGMRPSDVLFSDAILVVEGLSDEVFFHHLSNIIDAPLAGRHVKIVRSNGSSRGKRKVAFWAEVGRDAELPLYLILDKDARDEAEEAIEDDLVPREHCLILQKGNLEDYYPWRILAEVLPTQFGMDISEPIPVGERVQQLRSSLRRRFKGNTWKPMLAEEVAKALTLEEAEVEMGEIVDFLGKIHREMVPS